MSSAETRDHQVQTPAGRLFVREWRPAEDKPSEDKRAAPIILLHDSLGCVELWRDFPSALSARLARRVIAYDRLGFGRSDPFTGRLPLDFITTECRQSLPALLPALGIEQFVLFGHSVGGGMAVVGAAERGAACAALITEAAQVYGDEKTFAGIREARAVLSPGSPQYERLSKYHGAKTDWVLRSWIDNWLDPRFALDLTSFMKALRCPVLAFHGTRDEYGGTDHAEKLCDLAAGPAQLHILQAGGHVPHRERPAEVLDAVAAFLTKHTQARGGER